MPVTITGGRYAIRSLSAAATTTVTIATGTFVSGDFGANQRMVSLHSSAGAFKGIAWVRRFVSTTQLELEGRFVDPVTGLFATQVVGDQVLVSKNSAESAAPGFAVASPDNNVVTVTDNILMGTGGNETSLCFYDENKQFTMTNGFRFNGGVAVFGKLMSYDGLSKESFIWSRECTGRPNEAYPAGGGDPAFNVWGTGGTTGHMFFFGGAVGSPMRRSFFIGAQSTNATCGSFAFFGARLYHACASPNNGGNWASNPDRHLLYKTIHEADYNNANLIVWGNGAFQGEFLSFPQFGAGTPLGIFRASSAVTFGASPNNRTVVADTGSGAFIDDINNGSYTFINTITPFVTILRFAGGTVPIEFRFSDDYTNLQPRTTLVVRRGDGTLATSVVNTAIPTFTATVTQAIYSAAANGTATPTNFFTTFNYTAKCYGYQVVNGTHSTYTYSLGTAGNGTDLKLGGLINQVADAGVTLTETQALALSSKFTFNSGTNTWTVTANATYDEWYDYTIAMACSSVALAQVPSLSAYPLTWTGTALTAYTGSTLVVNAGVTFAEGTKFKSFFCPTVTNNGSITGIYSNTTGTSKTVVITVSAGSSIYVGDNATGVTRLFQSNVAAGTCRVFYAPSATAPTVLIARELYPFQRFAQVVTLVDGLNSFTPVDIEDVGISQATLATVQAYTSIENADKLYDRTAVFRLTEQGIKLGQIAARDGDDLRLTGFNLVTNQSAAVVYGVTGSTITLKATGYANGTKYTNTVLDNTKTLTAAGSEVISADFEDANGDSALTINGGDGTFELWKISTATATADYATGTKLTSPTIGNTRYRFTGVTGFDIVGVDINSNVRRRTSMTKGVYTQSFYVGDQIQLAQAPAVDDINTKVDLLQVDITAMKGASFDPATDSLLAIRDAVDGKPTLGDIEGSTVLAKSAEISELADGVADLPTADENADAVRTELATELGRIDAAVSTRSTLTAEDIPAGLTAAEVRTELATELGRIDVAVSTRSTLTTEDIPEGLTATEVWSATTRTLTESAGLTTAQAAQLSNIETLSEALPTLSEIEASTVLAKAAAVSALGTALADVPTSAENAAAVLGATVESGATVVQSLRLANAVLGGKVSGGQTGTETFRDLADTKDVIVSTNDAAGNRTAVTKNLG